MISVVDWLQGSPCPNCPGRGYIMTMVTSTPRNRSTVDIVDCIKSKFNNNSKELSSFFTEKRYVFIFNIIIRKIANEVSKLSQVLSEIRRVHFLGKTDNTCRMTIPREIVNRVGTGKHEYMQISLDEVTNRIIVEEIAGGQIDTK